MQKIKKKLNLVSISLDKNIALQRFSDAQNRQLEYAQYFNQYTIIVLTTYKDGVKTKKIGNLKIIPTNSPIKLLSLFDGVKIALRENKKNHFDLITAQDPIATGLVGATIKFFLKKPLNIQLHSEFIFNKEWLTERWQHSLWIPLIKWELHQADSIRIDNKAKLKKLFKKYPHLKAKIFQAPMRVETDFFWKKARKKRKISHLISVGRLAKEKNFPLLVKAMRRVIKKHPKVKLNIIGEGEQYLLLKELIEKYNLKNNIFLLGSLSREQVKEHLWKSDIFVLSSNYEGWGLVFIEAFAAGLPIVTTEVSSTGEIVKNGENGYAVPVGNDAKLAEKINDLIENPGKVYRFALRGQNLVREKFKPQKLVKAWIEGLYETKQK